MAEAIKSRANPSNVWWQEEQLWKCCEEAPRLRVRIAVMEDLPPAASMSVLLPQDTITTHVDPQAQPFLQLIKQIEGNAPDSLILINSKVDEAQIVLEC